MAHCKYHPLQAATYECPRCTLSHCDQCAGNQDRHGNTLCHFCESKMDSLGTGAAAEPFWRHLQEAFRYPLNWEALPVIITVAVVTSLLSAFPLVWIFTLLVYLALTGALFKYAFRCLERTAAGEMSAPSAGDAYTGGLSLLLKLILISIIAGGSLTLAAIFIGPTVAGILSTLFVISLPAVLIQFAQTENVIDALNPLNALRLITTIGLPYGLLIAFIMIMTGSVSVINELIGDRFSFLSMSLQSIISNYYTIVVFHIMGYMLFQYQDKLGYSARADNLDDQRDDLSILNAKIDINLKEGNYETVVTLFEKGIKVFPADNTLAQNFFEFSFNAKRPALIETSLNHYLNILTKNREFDKLNVAYTKARQINPNLIPSNPQVRLQLAVVYQAKGEAKIAVKLLNGIAKAHPQFAELDSVFTTMAKAFDDLHMQPQAEKCRAQAQKLQKKKQPQTPEQAPEQAPAPALERFAVRDVSTIEPPPQNTASPAAEPTALAEEKPEELPPIEFK